MRRSSLVLAALLLALALSGCSQPAADTAPTYPVLGATSSGDTPVTTPAERQAVGSHTFPREAFAGKPGASAIAVATGATRVSADAAAKAALPAEASSNPGVRLVSAIHVTLPAEFVRAVTGAGAGSQGRSAWAVTYAGVPLKNPIRVPAGTAPAAGDMMRVGDRTVLVDSDTGAVIASSEYVAR